MNINFILFSLPLPVEPHWTTPATSRLCWRGWRCKFMSEKCILGQMVFFYCTEWLSFLFAMPVFGMTTVVYVFLQGGCGEGCSQGLPGVPGTAGAKGEKGDTGKPGVTPLDSCDRVRLWGTGSFLSQRFQLPFMILHIQNHVTNSTVTVFVVVLWWMQNGNPSFCIVFKFAWLDVRSYHSDMIPCQQSDLALITSSLVCFPVFGETAERAGNRTSGQLRSLSYSKGMYTYVDISWYLMSLPHRMAEPTLEHLVFQECRDHQERGESQWVCDCFWLFLFAFVQLCIYTMTFLTFTTGYPRRERPRWNTRKHSEALLTLRIPQHICLNPPIKFLYLRETWIFFAMICFKTYFPVNGKTQKL